MLNNPLISEEFTAYIEANGYTGYYSDDKEIWTGISSDKMVRIKDDTIKFFTYCEGDDDRAPEFSVYGTVTGLSQLDFFKWQMVLHAFDIVPLRSFICLAIKENPERLRELVKEMHPNDFAY